MGCYRLGTEVRRTDGTNAATSVTSPDDYLFWEFDAVACPPIVASCDMDVSLYTDQAGLWIFDYLIIRGKGKAPQNSRLYPHTRGLVTTAPNVPNRRVQVPFGCVEVQLMDITGGSSQINCEREEIGRVDVGGSSATGIASLGSTGWDTAIVGRLPIGNARSIQILGNTAASNNLTPQVTFWCSL